MLIFGILGFILRRLDYPLAPIAVAMVLANGTETALRQSLMMSDGSLGIFLYTCHGDSLNDCGVNFVFPFFGDTAVAASQGP